MATETVNQGANRAPTRQRVEALRQRALGVLEERIEEEGRAYAIATAGRSFTMGDDGNIERRLFEAIEDILVDATLTNMLRDVINELASFRLEDHHEKV